MAGGDFLKELQAVLGPERLLTGTEDRWCYAFDAAAAQPKHLPLAVALPRSTEEVAGIMKLATAYRVPVYPRGSGTNLSGGVIPREDGLVISFVEMNNILELDIENLTATVQPGVVIQELNDAVAPYGLIYPPDPGSVATATMGGSVAESSGGLRGLKYGVTKDYVMGLEVVLADGTVFHCGGKTVKNVSGYDLVKLFCGSEGTLGIMTAITVRLTPAPEARRSMLAVFDRLEGAARTITGIIANKVIPATMEIMDNVTIRTVEAYCHAGLPVEAAAVLLLEVDGIPAVVEKEAAIVERVCRENGGQVRVARDDAERENLWTARRAALPACARLRPTTVLEDATVPRSKIPEMLLALERIARKYNVSIATYGHAGDGNLHPTITCDERDQEEMERVHRAVDEIFHTAIALGGTLSGEHGIGLAKQKYMELEFGASGVAVMQRLKQALDPLGILNPGKLVGPLPVKE
ncbi:putative FAD-linked oxidoreductase [Neomoorella glycerini]|uniref:Putative FAD-linked oxidoreductase n=1 Tax=Neomoorella glycerini TaxID=55779 RepID=A0A6I5ZPT1_9FIRM|nr:FAD-linked oxidase C-terminal domain-containing protein [Moorella glycerini]QGP91617.1 putative FAD-linked oxidoreductase [Moorella glycerini]